MRCRRAVQQSASVPTEYKGEGEEGRGGWIDGWMSKVKGVWGASCLVPGGDAGESRRAQESPAQRPEQMTCTLRGLDPGGPWKASFSIETLKK